MLNNTLAPKWLCQHYINILYKNVTGHPKEKNTDKTKIAETYGEILSPSIDKLLNTVPLSEQDIFLDVGAGLGKLALQVFLTAAAKEVYGIELLPRLHEHASRAAETMSEELPECFENNRKLIFIEGDFLSIPWPNATVVLIGSPCFGPDLLAELAWIIERTSSIHTVLSLRPLLTLKRLHFVQTVRVECSWDTALCYIYKQ